MLIKSDGRELRVWRAGVDTGGGKGEAGLSMTEETYMWLRKNGRGRGCRVWGTKGASRPLAGKVHVGKAMDRTPSGKPSPGGLQIVSLDTDKLKDTVHYRLAQAADRGPYAAFLHAYIDDQYVRQILAEEEQCDRNGRLRRSPNGSIAAFTNRPGVLDNHLLDVEVILYALADLEWPGCGVHLLRGFDVTHWMPLPPMPIDRLVAFKNSIERILARRDRKPFSPP